MTNKEDAVSKLYYRIEALSGNFVKASKDEAVELAKKINIYGRLKEVLEAEIAKESADNAKLNKPTYTNKIDSTTVNNFGW